MISEKMTALGKKSSVIREIFEYGNRRRAEIGAENVFDFSLGNPSIPAPDKLTETMQNLISQKDAVALHGYTSAPGAMEVRSSIAEYITNAFGVKANPERIYMTCGAAASLTITLTAMVAGAEDEIVVPSPFFPEYRVFVERTGAKLVTAPCRPSDFQIDLTEMDKAVGEHTKAVLINSPNNPTGAVYSLKTLTALAELLRKKEEQFGHPIYLIADEPYRELAYGAEVPYLPALYGDTVVCYSYSKSLSLPGERIGYIFVPDSVTDGSDLFAAVCGAGRALGFVCAPSLLQYTVANCQGLTADINVYKENRDLFYKELTDIGFTVVPPDGAFYLFVKSPESDAAAFCERAKQWELLLVPSDDFGCTGYVRISYCVTKSQIERALPAFRALWESYR